jgi:hypothetical protein
VVHAEAAEVETYFPKGQAMHTDDAVAVNVEEYRPTAQLVHVLSPVSAPKYPTGHGVQLKAPKKNNKHY